MGCDCQKSQYTPMVSDNGGIVRCDETLTPERYDYDIPITVVPDAVTATTSEKVINEASKNIPVNANIYENNISPYNNQNNLPQKTYAFLDKNKYLIIAGIGIAAYFMLRK